MRRAILGVLMWGVLLVQLGAQSIYTCVDAKGRRLTADRPIAECTDREQRVLSSGGLVKGKLAPTLTAEEQAAAELKAQKAVEERNRQAEEKRINRALLNRYPNRAAHDKERDTAAATADNVVVAANKRLATLQEDRKRLDVELEFFQGDIAKAPVKLKRQIDDNTRNIEAQKRFIVDKQAERKRIDTRYDQELIKLNQLWAQREAPVRPPASAPSASR